jgi:hypothetical protein
MRHMKKRKAKPTASHIRLNEAERRLIDEVVKRCNGDVSPSEVVHACVDIGLRIIALRVTSKQELSDCLNLTWGEVVSVDEKSSK